MANSNSLAIYSSNGELKMELSIYQEIYKCISNSRYLSHPMYSTESSKRIIFNVRTFSTFMNFDAKIQVKNPIRGLDKNKS